MRLVNLLMALAALSCLWAVALFFGVPRHYAPLLDVVRGLSLGFDLSAQLALFAELWRDRQRKKLTEAQDRLEAWRAQVLDWRGSEGISENTRRTGGIDHAPDQRANHRGGLWRHRSGDGR